FFFSSRRRHTRWPRDWSSDVCSSDLGTGGPSGLPVLLRAAWVQSVVFPASAARLLRTNRTVEQTVSDHGTVRAVGYGKAWQRARSEERRVGKECRCRRAWVEENQRLK